MPIRKIRQLRIRGGLTQKELSEKLGVSRTHLCELEHGAHPLTDEMIIKYVDYFRVDYDKVVESEAGN